MLHTINGRMKRLKLIHPDGRQPGIIMPYHRVCASAGKRVRRGFAEDMAHVGAGHYVEGATAHPYLCLCLNWWRGKSRDKVYTHSYSVALFYHIAYPCVYVFCWVCWGIVGHWREDGKRPRFINTNIYTYRLNIIGIFTTMKEYCIENCILLYFSFNNIYCTNMCMNILSLKCFQ